MVSADSRTPEETKEVGAVDWLSTLDGREGISDIGLLGDVVVC